MTSINTNVSAQLTANALTQNNRAMSQTMERLSTGSRINSAADDAAGLAIVSKMDAQVTGLNQAVRNANDAISMIQTADGAAVEIDSMLQRMREISVSSSNGTNTTADLTNMNKEFANLATEIQRVVDTTQFNNTNILDGSVGTNGVVSFNIGANASQTVDVDFANFALGSSTATSDEQTIALTLAEIQAVPTGSEIQLSEADGSTIIIDDAAIVAAQALTGGVGTDLQDTDFATFIQAANTQMAANTSMNQMTFAVGSADISILGTRANEGVGGLTSMVQKVTATGVESVISANASVGDTVGSAAVRGTQSLNITLAEIQAVPAGSETIVTDSQGATFNITDAHLVTAGATSGHSDATSAHYLAALNTRAAASTSFEGVTFAIGDLDDTITAIQDVAGTGSIVSVNQRTAAGLEATLGTLTQNAVGKVAGDADVMAADISDFLVAGTQAQATTTLDELDAAIAGLASQRAEFGSWVNRLEHTVDNLTNVSQNTSASRSRIEDADYAVETSELARTQIISQAATAMLSQANQQAQSVLALLK